MASTSDCLWYPHVLRQMQAYTVKSDAVNCGSQSKIVFGRAVNKKEGNHRRFKSSPRVPAPAVKLGSGLRDLTPRSRLERFSCIVCATGVACQVGATSKRRGRYLPPSAGRYNMEALIQYAHVVATLGAVLIGLVVVYAWAHCR